MNDESFRVASTLINAKYIDQSHQAIKKRQKLFQTLLSQRCMPEKGWDNVSIQAFIDQMSQMDCNNQLDTVGVGEREGRVFSSLVASRHFYLAHGVGRSGDLTENQPKASGSSLISALCNHLVKHALKLAGVQQVKQCLVVPMCTGMTLSLVLRSLFLHEKQKKQQQGEAQNSDDDHRSETRRKYVIWSRIDQKSCLKCIQTAGFEPIVIENVYCDQDHENEDGLCTNLAEMELQIERLGAENILCVLSTTSCFAPRLPDKVVAISKLCKKYDIGHVVNNAYGVQCKKTMSQISAAMSQGRLDAFIQSTDKNFMVPVGGSIVASNNIQFMNRIASTYAGRASIAPILDLFITLLSMGVDQWTNLLQQRMETLPLFKSKMQEIALKYNEQLLTTNSNTISFAMTVNQLDNPSQLGAQLFYRGVSGIRVVPKQVKKEVTGITFEGYGSHTNHYPHHYLTVACAIGIKKEDVEQFITVFDKMLHKMYKKEAQERVEKNANQTDTARV